MSDKTCLHHHHHDHELSWALGINVLLSVVQVVGGLVSGSLALVADALHNLSDAASLLLALVAQKIARRAPDAKRTYGYKKVETLSAYTNYIVLIVISAWLAIEAVFRLIRPETVYGWTVIWISILAVAINLVTVFLTRHGAKDSHNIRAAYLHNLGDALSSIGVIVAGVLIVAFDWTWIDPLVTLGIAGFIVWHVVHEIPVVANILIDGNPDHENVDKIERAIAEMDGVQSVHHFHMRALDEHRNAVEAHIVMVEGNMAETLRADVKKMLEDRFRIRHSFLEIETVDCGERSCL